MADAWQTRCGDVVNRRTPRAMPPWRPAPPGVATLALASRFFLGLALLKIGTGVAACITLPATHLRLDPEQIL